MVKCAAHSVQKPSAKAFRSYWQDWSMTVSLCLGLPPLIAGHFGQHRTSASKTPGVPCFLCSRSCSWELVNKRLVSDALLSLRNSSRSWMDRCTRACELGRSAASNQWQCGHATITFSAIQDTETYVRCVQTATMTCACHNKWHQSHDETTAQL